LIGDWEEECHRPASGAAGGGAALR